MRDRAEGAARIARLRREMARLAEWRRLASERRFADVNAARQDLEAFVAAAQPDGLMARLAFAQAGRLEKRREDASAARDHDVGVSLDAQRKLKAAELMADELARAERARAERKDLERLIESLARGPDPASLP